MRSVDACGACRSVRGLLFAVVLCSVVGLPNSAVFADLVNGNFDDGLNGWDAYENVNPVGGKAVLGENGYLEQAFTIPAGSASLSFTYSAIFDPTVYEDVIYVQTFTASLFCGPFIPWDTYGDGSLGLPEFFIHDSDTSLGEDGLLYDKTYVNVQDDLVTLTLPNLDADAWITFDFLGAFATVDGLVPVAGTGTITLDNVSLTVVPVPPAVVLFVLGMGTAGAMLRRRLSRTV